MSIKILAVEDDPIYAQSLTLVVADLGYELAGIADNATDALALLQQTSPDLVLMDIDINDKLTGIELAARMNRLRPTPVIYVTAFRDKDIFQQAKLTGPAAYIVKPYEPVSLQSAIELALDSIPAETNLSNGSPAADTFYVKDNNRFTKVRLDEILLIEVDEKYCFIVTARKRHIINMRLKDVLQKLPAHDFIQVHRSFVVRKSAIDEVNTGEQTLRVGEKTIPMGKTYKEHLLAALNYL